MTPLIDKFLRGFRTIDDGEVGILYRKDDGSIWYRKPDGSEAEIGSGGGSVQNRAEYGSGPPTTFNHGEIALLPFGTTRTGGDTDLLDFTDPTLPTMLTAGVYAIGASVRPQSDITPGTGFDLLLDIDYSGDDAQFYNTAAIVSDAPLGIWGVYFCPAGGGISVTLTNQDTATRDFVLEIVNIQRLS